jgi:hypothetical protein
MPDERFEERLRRALEQPGLTAPTPVQARYRLARANAAARPRGRVWVRVVAAFAAGGLAAIAVLSASTGSTNPRVWSGKVVSTLIELRPEPAPAPTQTPTAIPSTSVPAPSGPQSQPAEGGHAESPEPAQERGGGSPEPQEGSSASPGSADRSGDDSDNHHPSPSPTSSEHPHD